MTIKEKEMKISQTYRAASIAAHAINSGPQEPKSALRGLMRRLGLVFLACTLVIGATGSASAGEPGDEAAVRALGDGFAKAFVQKSPVHQARCCGRRRAPYRTQCQRSGWDGHPRDTDQLFLRGRPPRRSMADRGWARAFRTRAA